MPHLVKAVDARAKMHSNASSPKRSESDQSNSPMPSMAGSAEERSVNGGMVLGPYDATGGTTADAQSMTSEESDPSILDPSVRQSPHVVASSAQSGLDGATGGLDLRMPALKGDIGSATDSRDSTCIFESLPNRGPDLGRSMSSSSSVNGVPGLAGQPSEDLPKIANGEILGEDVVLESKHQPKEANTLEHATGRTSTRVGATSTSSFGLPAAATSTALHPHGYGEAPLSSSSCLSSRAASGAATSLPIPPRNSVATATTIDASRRPSSAGLEMMQARVCSRQSGSLDLRERRRDLEAIRQPTPATKMEAANLEKSQKNYDFDDVHDDVDVDDDDDLPPCPDELDPNWSCLGTGESEGATLQIPASTIGGGRKKRISQTNLENQLFLGVPAQEPDQLSNVGRQAMTISASTSSRSAAGYLSRPGPSMMTGSVGQHAALGNMTTHQAESMPPAEFSASDRVGRLPGFPEIRIFAAPWGETLSSSV